MDKNKKLFPQRLWELIHDQKYNFCLRWSPDGQRVYLNRNEFEAHYLKTPNNQFHTQKAISFVRQMNMYGFRKVDDCYYENDNFKRNCSHLLKNMVRRHSNRGFFSPPATNNENQQLTTHNNNHHHNNNNQHHHHHHHHSHDLIQTSINTTNTGGNSPIGGDQNSLESQQLQLSSTPISQIQPHSLYRDQQASSPVELLERLVANAVQNAQNFVDTNSGDSMPLEAAMVAALNSTNNPTNPCSPLASSLYLRLAALNFGQTQAINPMTAQNHSINNLIDRQQSVKTASSNMTQSPQLMGPSINTMNSPSLSPLLANYGMNNSLNSSQNSSTNTTVSNSSNSSISNGSIGNNNNSNNNGRIHRSSPIINQNQQHSAQQQIDTIDIPMGLQQSLAARQAIQQTLVRSLLQMKQPLLLQQNLLPTLQNCDPNLLLETLVNLNNNNNNNNNNSSNLGPSTAEQVDLVSPRNFLTTQYNPQRPSAPASRNHSSDFGDNNNIQLSPRFITSGNDTKIASFLPQQMNSIRNNFSGENLLVDEDDDDLIEVDDKDDNVDDDDQGMSNYNNQVENVNNMNLTSSPLSSSHYNQQGLNQNDLNETVLDLAKPSSKNSSNV